MDIYDLLQRAKFTPGDPVVWNGTPYRVTVRYWRQSTNGIVYDLRESAAPGRTPLLQRKVTEQQLQKPSPEAMGWRKHNGHWERAGNGPGGRKE